MRLQKATQCALFAVLELAQNPEHQVSAADIAEKYSISANHLAKVMRDLSRAGLVDSMRGAGGGYRFSGNAKRITLYDIVKMFEDVGQEGRPEAGDDSPIGRALKQVTTEIDEITVSTLKSITLSTLMKLTQRHQSQT
ncbi:MAG: Rrf2 family transcriptional regulator [Rhodospirillales bacterium]|nr:Rrf2 family transcriptional regulator [Rhodospirillales bacterium]